MNYVFDTSAVIVLIEICKLEDELLRFSNESELYVPLRVKEEFLDGASVSDAEIFNKVFSTIHSDLEEELLPYFNFCSSDGAIWVMSYGLKNPNCCCVIDEDFGKKICNHFNVKSTGAIGIIIKMKAMGLLSNKDIQKIKDRIRESRFYYTEKLLSELNSYP